MTARLSLATLPAVARAGLVRTPAYDPAGVRVGILHLGIGAFHRAHQAVFTEDAMVASGRTDWGICGVTQRSPAVRDQLAPQDGLYTVLERGAGAAPSRVVGTVRSVLSGVDEAAEVVRRVADRDVRIVTVTVTEKGYRRGLDGGLDVGDPVVSADVAWLAGAMADDSLPAGGPRSTVGQITAGLYLRRREHGAAITVLSCDNLSGNGAVLRRLVRDFCAALPASHGRRLADWIEECASFPSSMVDRMVPATTDGDRAEVAGLLGVTDAGTVVAEPFSQWVIEDDFVAGRPWWEDAGAVLTTDVVPYETVKLRMLNAAHSLLAYTGALAGYATIAEAVADRALAQAASDLMEHDASATLAAPDGVDLAGYRRSVLERFANPALGHRTAQVASDGSQKLPIRLLGTARDLLAEGRQPRWVALAVAAWAVYVADGVDRTGRRLPLDDPLADRLRSALAGHGAPAALAGAALAIREVFPEDLATDPVFRDLLTEQVRALRSGCGAGAS